MKKIFKYLKPYTFFIILSIIFTFIQAILNLYLPDLMSDIVNNGVVGQNMDEVFHYGIRMFVVAMIGMVASIISTYIAARVSSKFGQRLRNAVFSKVENLSLKEFNKISTSSLITRTTNDVTQIQQLTLMAMRIMIIAPLMCIGGIIMAIRKNMELSMLFIVVFPVIIFVILMLAKHIIPLFTKMQKLTDRLNQVIREKLTGVRVIRAFNKQQYEAKRYDKANFDIYETSLKVGNAMANMMPIIFFIINISSVVIIWYGANLIDVGSLEIGDMMAFMQYALQALFSVLMLTMIFMLVPRGIVSAKRIAEILNLESSVVDNENIIKKEDILKPGQIEFENVEFRYDKDSAAILKDISFTVKKGETLAILGGTGSGKSTILNLMLRFYDPTKGSIKIGGVDIKEISIKSLRNMIGFVPQKVNLFSGTIADNIRFGKEDATIEEITEAAKLSQSYDFISKLDNGFDSYVAQGGTNFSGGQKQRISIARAIVKKPDIYVFDDSFSALDYTTDRNLREALNKNTKESTKIIVAQRVSTVLNADKIIYIEEGKILAIGTHKELYNTCEEYREVVLSQITKEEAI